MKQQISFTILFELYLLWLITTIFLKMLYVYLTFLKTKAKLPPHLHRAIE